MKKTLMILGGVFLFLIIAAGGMIGVAAFKGSKLDAESQTYLEATLPQVLSHPTAENFLSFVAAQDRGAIDPTAMQQFVSFINMNLGAFQSCADMDGSSLQMFTPNGEAITAKYLANCRFSKASVRATISLRKTGEAWSLVSVYFDTGSLHPAVPPGSSTSL